MKLSLKKLQIYLSLFCFVVWSTLFIVTIIYWCLTSWQFSKTIHRGTNIHYLDTRVLVSGWTLRDNYTSQIETTLSKGNTLCRMPLQVNSVLFPIVRPWLCCGNFYIFDVFYLRHILLIMYSTLTSNFFPICSNWKQTYNISINCKCFIILGFPINNSNISIIHKQL